MSPAGLAGGMPPSACQRGGTGADGRLQMAVLGHLALQHGPPRFSAAAAWPPLPALSATVLLMAVAMLTGHALVSAVAALGADAMSQGGLGPAERAILFLLGLQVTVVIGTLALAGWRGRRPREVLGLAGPRPSLRVMAEAVALCLVLIAIYNLVVWLAGVPDLLADLKALRPLLASPLWPLAVLVLTVGAPLSEELLFRGFLLPALARARGRFIGAAALSTLAWTGLHAGYSAAGMIEVFLVGLYFCWLVWRTGGVALPLACHIVVNASVLMVMALLPALPG